MSTKPFPGKGFGINWRVMSSAPNRIIQTSSPHASYLAHRTEIDAAICAVLDQPQHVLGHAVEGLEARLADYLGLAHAVGVGNGTEALCLALCALGAGPGDEVITTSFTAVATVAAVMTCGAEPVLVDVERPWCTIDVSAVEAAIGPRTRAVVAVHLYGQPVELDRLTAVCAKHHVALIEDCAQSIGATWQGRPTGSLGEASCFSFYPTKNLGTVGDGGLVASNDAGLADRIRRLRQYGWNEQRISEEVGRNSRLGPLEAAILSAKLPFLVEAIRKRRQIARHYISELHGVPVVLPLDRPGAEHAYHLFVVQCENGAIRDRLRDHLLAAGIVAGIHYPVPVHLQPAYRSVRVTSPMTNTLQLAEKVLSIPIYPELPDTDQEWIVDRIRAFFGERR